jgi:prepilin-type processing-associated H-X9-DG protein/prepilin-type N-terminal cleavage/methylation domain-containing protein
MADGRDNTYNKRTLTMKMNNKFTLIELLIVIAIISILASMLLPALKKAKSTATRIACGNTEKNVMQASFMYANDYYGYLPTCSEDGGVWRVNWVRQIAPYWGGNYDMSDYPKIMENKVISCPATPEVILHARRDNSGYGFSQPILYLDSIKLSSIRIPSQCIVMGDTWDRFDDPDHYENEYLWKTPGKIGSRHQNGINVAFADGHVLWHRTIYLQSHPELYEND